MKVLIKDAAFNGIPGLGGLNRFAFIEDGWTPGLLLEVLSRDEDGVYIKLPNNEFNTFLKNNEINVAS